MSPLRLVLLACLGAGLAPLARAQALSAPESVEYDAAGQRWLVSNRGAGQILARTPDGTLSLFSDDPASPAGIEIVGELLYVADGGRVRAYRLADGVRVVDHPLGATFLNGIASDGGGRLWVSDFSGRDIYQLDVSNPASVSHVEVLPNLANTPNGLWWDAAQQRLLIVTWGASARIFGWQPGDSAPTLLLQTSLSNLDGVAIDCQGATYVSSWGAQAILRIAPPLSAQSLPVTFAPGLSNPADIHYAAATGVIGNPNAGNSTLSFHPTACAAVLFEDGFEQD